MKDVFLRQVLAALEKERSEAKIKQKEIEEDQTIDLEVTKLINHMMNHIIFRKYNETERLFIGENRNDILYVVERQKNLM